MKQAMKNFTKHSKALGFKVFYKTNEVRSNSRLVVLVIVQFRNDETLKLEILVKTERMSKK